MIAVGTEMEDKMINYELDAKVAVVTGGVVGHRPRLRARHAGSGCARFGAVDIELTADDLRKIDEAAAKITIQRARYPSTWSAEPTSSRT